MFGRRPTGRLLYAWDFAEVRWQKIREIREKLSAATSDASKCPQSFCHNPSRKGTFKAQKAINMLKEYGWICTTLSSGRSTSRNSSRTSPGEQAEGLPDPSCYWWRHGFYSQAWAWEDDLLDEARPHIRSELSGTNV